VFFIYDFYCFEHFLHFQIFFLIINSKSQISRSRKIFFFTFGGGVLTAQPVGWIKNATESPKPPMQCNAMQCNAMQCNAMQCNAMQCNAMQCNAMLDICFYLEIQIFRRKNADFWLHLWPVLVDVSCAAMLSWPAWPVVVINWSRLSTLLTNGLTGMPVNFLLIHSRRKQFEKGRNSIDFTAENGSNGLWQSSHTSCQIRMDTNNTS
jgi:hypothetical protein